MIHVSTNALEAPPKLPYDSHSISGFFGHHSVRRLSPFDRVLKPKHFTVPREIQDANHRDPSIMELPNGECYNSAGFISNISNGNITQNMMGQIEDFSNITGKECLGVL